MIIYDRFLTDRNINLNISPTRRNNTEAVRQMAHCCEVRDSVPNIFWNKGISVIRTRDSRIQPYANMKEGTQ